MEHFNIPDREGIEFEARTGGIAITGDDYPGTNYQSKIFIEWVDLSKVIDWMQNTLREYQENEE